MLPDGLKKSLFFLLLDWYKVLQSGMEHGLASKNQIRRVDMVLTVLTHDYFFEKSKRKKK
jgi:hypothetical protein